MMILAFLNFHRRYIIGTLLLAFVAYFLVYLNNSNSTDEFNESVAQVNDPTSQSAGLAIDVNEQLARPST